VESFGRILRETRERKNLTAEQIARDTRISRRYLEALEEEDFSLFPGETYLIGFLRNYAEYLGLDKDELVTIYRNMKIQEQPLPMDELLNARQGPPRGLVILLVVLLVGVLGGGGYVLYNFLNRQEPRQAGTAPAEEPRDGQDYVFQADGLTQWFNQGDRILVPMGDRRREIEITAIDQDRVELNVPGGMIRLNLSEDRFVDLNLDNRPDIKMVFNDIDLLASTRRVNLGLSRLREAEQAAAASAAASAAAGTVGQTQGATVRPAAPAAPTAPPPPPAAAADARGAGEIADRQVVLSADGPRVFGVTIDFRGDTLFRYLIDNSSREQRFFQRGETFSVDSVRNEIQLWVSNAGAARVTVEGRDIAFGRPGQVVTKVVRWVQNETSGRYDLEVASAY
jgi:cytoskeletal protein RodZ